MLRQFTHSSSTQVRSATTRIAFAALAVALAACSGHVTGGGNPAQQAALKATQGHPLTLTYDFSYASDKAEAQKEVNAYGTPPTRNNGQDALGKALVSLKYATPLVPGNPHFDGYLVLTKKGTDQAKDWECAKTGDSNSGVMFVNECSVPVARITPSDAKFQDVGPGKVVTFQCNPTATDIGAALPADAFVRKPFACSATMDDKGNVSRWGQR